MVKSVHVPVITIDGPSGSGKGTVARLLAQTLAFHVLDSGALYRLLALAASWHGIALDAEQQLGVLARDLDCRFVGAEYATDILLEGQCVTENLRTEFVGNAASLVAVYPQVRRQLLARQRAFAISPGLVADGRDMGTVVFPEADLKFYLDASVQERALRRLRELQQRGIDGSLDSLCLDLRERDKRDKERRIAPLKPALDAVVIDSTRLSALETVRKMVEVLRVRTPHLWKEGGGIEVSVRDKQ